MIQKLVNKSRKQPGLARQTPRSRNISSSVICYGRCTARRKDATLATGHNVHLSKDHILSVAKISKRRTSNFTSAQAKYRNLKSFSSKKVVMKSANKLVFNPNPVLPGTNLPNCATQLERPI